MCLRLKTSLLPHQAAAVEKLKKIKIGALYMEMGTGKTRTVLELVKLRLDSKKIEHVLWLCPCSVKKSLEMDLKKHADDISDITICGIETLSQSDREYIRLLKLVKQKKCFLVVDESNLVKNFRAIRTKRIIELSNHCQYKVILNGTPVSRNEADLFAQWYILDWRILGYRSYYSFARNHLEYDERGRLRRVLETDYLTRKIAPYTYQIRKSECLNLPEKKYLTLYFDLDSEQRYHYYQVAEALLFSLDEYDDSTIYRLLSGVQAVASGYFIKNADVERGRFLDITDKERFHKDLDKNPRLQRLMDYIYDLEYDEKAVIFAKYTDEIDEIITYLEKEFGEGSAVRFDGTISLKQRNENIERFKQDARFLVGNKQTAGYGLNLQFAHHVIFYSNDWDWATREQAEDRVHRIGQDYDVRIVDIVANNTIDERIVANLARKTDLVEDLKKAISKWKDRTDIKPLEEWLNAEKKERQKIAYRATRRREKQYRKRMMAR